MAFPLSAEEINNLPVDEVRRLAVDLAQARGTSLQGDEPGRLPSGGPSAPANLLDDPDLELPIHDAVRALFTHPFVDGNPLSRDERLDLLESAEIPEFPGLCATAADPAARNLIPATHHVPTRDLIGGIFTKLQYSVLDALRSGVWLLHHLHSGSAGPEYLELYATTHGTLLHNAQVVLATTVRELGLKALGYEKTLAPAPSTTSFFRSDDLARLSILRTTQGLLESFSRSAGQGARASRGRQGRRRGNRGRASPGNGGNGGSSGGTGSGGTKGGAGAKANGQATRNRGAQTAGKPTSGSGAMDTDN